MRRRWMDNFEITLPCLIIVGSNRLKWVAFSENNRPKTKNYTTMGYKILPKPEFTKRFVAVLALLPKPKVRTTWTWLWLCRLSFNDAKTG